MRHPRGSQGRNEDERKSAIENWNKRDYGGGYPIWYNCTVDFEKCRRSRQPVQLIDIVNNDTESVLRDMKRLNYPHEVLFALKKRHKHWGITCKEDKNEFLDDLKRIQEKFDCPYIREVKETKGLFSVMIRLHPRDVYFFTANSP